MRLFTLRGPVLRVPWPLVITGWAVRLAAVTVLRLALFARHHPDTAALAALVAGVWLVVEAHGPGGPLIVLATVAVCAWLWAATDPKSFDRFVTTPARSRWRRQLVYRREWQPAMLVNGLDLGGELPALRTVVSTPGLDVVRVTIVPGQTLDDWRKAGPRLAAAFGVRVVRPRKVPGRPHELELHARRGERLVEGTSATPEVDEDAPPASSGGAFRRDR